MLDWIATHRVELIFVTAYLGLLLHHALSSRAKVRNSSDYITGGGKMGGWVIALSFYATFVSTNSFVGHAGKSWDVGLIWYIKGAVIVLACYASWYLLAPRFVARAREYKSLTLPDFLGSRYDSPAMRRASAVVIAAASVVFMVAVYKGSAMALGEFLGFDYSIAVVTIFIVVTGYTLAGGFRSVVLTDAVQGGLMVIGAIAIVIALVVRGGGVTEILETLRQEDPHLVSWQGRIPMGTLLGLSLAGAMKMLVDPRQVSRFYGLRDKKALGLARIVAPILIAVTYVCLLPVGAMAHAVIPAGTIEDSDQVMPYLLGTAKILGPVLSSLFLLVLFSAAMSSLDSVLLVSASSVSRDLLVLDDDGPKAVRRTRTWVVLLSIVGLIMALNPFGDIVTITAFSGSLYAACFLPALLLGLYWSRGTKAGSLASLTMGGITVVGWHFARKAGWTTWHELFVGVGVSFGVYLLVSLMSSRPKDSKLQVASRSQKVWSSLP